MKKGKISVLRYDPEIDPAPHYETYEYPFEEGMSVLDVASYIYKTIDGTFGFSHCCRNSHCGLCGAKINGRPGLMCRETATREMTLEPLDNLPVIRDVIVERQEYEELMPAQRLFLERIDLAVHQPEKIEANALDLFKVASRCIECYCCISACPAYGESKHEFLGPAGFVLLARHAFDPRDTLDRELMAYTAGLHNCTHCGKCTDVCPQNAAPRENIDLLCAKVADKDKAPRL